MKFQPWMLAVLPLALFGFGAVSTLTNPEIQEGRALQRNTAQNRAQARVEARQGEANSQLAITRYQSGNCLLSTVPIKPGMVFSGVPTDVSVCDDQGWTAQLGSDGTVQKLAYTSDTDVIRGFLGW